MQILTQAEWLQRLSAHQHPSRTQYRAMFSTWWQGIVTDPNLMLIPIDDHQVHRGDAVFEALKAVDGKVYLQDAHLDRLEQSGVAIGLKNPLSRTEMQELFKECLKASGLKDALFRLFLGRGPGSFSTHPGESVGAQVHLIATDLKELSSEKVREGVTGGISKVPPKEPWLARIKSCNYLQNVLMKKEAVERGLDFTVGVSAHGVFTEGSTENLMIVCSKGELVRPRLDGILAGTTMLRAFELAKGLQASGLLTGFSEKDLQLQDLLEAREVLMAGTTLDVVAMTRFEGKPLGNGAPGPVAQELRRLIQQDQKEGSV